MVERTNPNINPFWQSDPDRAQIWDMLVARDIDAFAAADWSMVASDFHEDEFFALDANKTDSVENWRPSFGNLGEYREEWLRQARQARSDLVQVDLTQSLFELTRLEQIDINGETAVAHKHFDGSLEKRAGGREPIKWQTLYFCRKIRESWKICGFLGYLPFPLVSSEATGPVIQPPDATQHVSAGPYSPVLRITQPKELVVISGQASLDLEGNVVGASIEEQTRITLENCATQLNNAGCTFADVFKVNVYLTDLDEWPRFNAVYQEIMPQPFPVRAAVQTGLLFDLKVEIEMWAAK